MPIYQIDGLTPVVPEESFVHPDSGIDRRCYSRQGRLRWAKCQPAWRFWSYRGERWREHSG